MSGSQNTNMETLLSKHPAYIVLYMYLAIFYTVYLTLKTPN